ncbi:MAG TPA: hypothetical protein VF550_17500, partial [Polyangia bacterium]
KVTAKMETLGGLAAHSAPATHPATPALRAASPNLPALWLRRAKPGSAYAIMGPPWKHLAPRSGSSLPRKLGE